MNKRVSYRLDELLLNRTRQMAETTGQTDSAIIEAALALTYELYKAIEPVNGKINSQRASDVASSYMKDLRDRMLLITKSNTENSFPKE